MKTWLVLVVTFALHCSGSHVEEEERESAIVGGSADRSHRAVVALGIDGSLCSGALIAPDVVLTARHCVSEVSSIVSCDRDSIGADRDPRAVYVYEGDNVARSNPIARGKRFVFPRVRRLCGNDIALVVLDRKIGWIEPLAIAEAPKPGASVTVIGYGRDDRGRSGTRMKRRSRIFSRTTFELELGEAVCAGDSGGPALDSNGAVVAVVSRGTSPCKSPYAMNIFTRVDAHEDLFSGG